MLQNVMQKKHFYTEKYVRLENVIYLIVTVCVFRKLMYVIIIDIH